MFFQSADPGKKVEHESQEDRLTGDLFMGLLHLAILYRRWKTEENSLCEECRPKSNKVCALCAEIGRVSKNSLHAS